MQDFVSRIPAVVFTCVVRADGTPQLNYISESCTTLLGLSPSDLIKRYTNCLDMVHPDDRALFEETFREGIANQKAWWWEGRLKINNTVRWVELRSSTPVQGEQLTYTGLILNIDERKKQEEERLKKSETLFNRLFNNVPVALVLLDEKGKVLLVNRGFNEMFGYELIELRGKNLNDFIVPENLQNEGIDLNNLITSNNTISLETVRKHRNGKPVNVILYGVPVTLEDKTIGIYGVYVDITERKKIEEELKIRNTELDNFVYKVSHDLRAPLSSVLGLVNLARLPGNTDDPRMYIKIIGEKVQELDRFISDVLSHAKNLKMEVAVAKIEFVEMLSKTFSDLSYLPGAGEVELSTQITGEEFYSDPWRLGEIFRNLVSNSIKYRNQKQSRPLVNVQIHTTVQQCHIKFSDNGIGIAEPELDKIFNMFYRASEQSDGSGIGLYIVKNAVEKLGGRIHVKSSLGFGTTFEIVLPNLKHLQQTEVQYRYSQRS
ncbi:MAG: PAS domain S-box protein [Cyclobacteriaceae bacterium]|nr:PAS domain S-box protein [Cyclobacteriaceae bacterium]MCX7636588.1 PAS domain S-box protein [Cyclobacteriaceae bacterium]MDW8330602.1 PAS domain S-box protein [Cyclobacteriaceae bacterium]